MRTQVLALGVLLALAGGCRDHARRAARRHAAPVHPAASRAVPAPVLVASATTLPAAASAASPAIDDLDAAPPEARDRLERVAGAVAHDRRDAFLAAVSTGGFAVGELALDHEQVEAELAGRTVAELAELPCGARCRWRVAKVGPTRLELEARDAGETVGVLALMHDDDGSWGVVAAHR